MSLCYLLLTVNPLLPAVFCLHSHICTIIIALELVEWIELIGAWLPGAWPSFLLIPTSTWCFHVRPLWSLHACTFVIVDYKNYILAFAHCPNTPTMILSVLVAAALVSLVTAQDIPSTFPDIGSCASEPSFFSCENTTAITNTCCSPTPGGLVLVTQFWSTWTGLEEAGQLLPKDSWGIHGL